MTKEELKEALGKLDWEGGLTQVLHYGNVFPEHSAMYQATYMFQMAYEAFQNVLLSEANRLGVDLSEFDCTESLADYQPEEEEESSEDSEEESDDDDEEESE
jgi:hypothetical protein